MVGYFYQVTEEDIKKAKEQYPHLKPLGVNEDPLKVAKKNMLILLKEEYPLYAMSVKISRFSGGDKLTISIPDYDEDNKIKESMVYDFISSRFKDSVRDIANEANNPPVQENMIFQKVFGSTSYISVVRSPATEKEMAIYNKKILEIETENIKPNKKTGLKM